MIVKTNIPLAIARFFPAASLGKSAILALQSSDWPAEATDGPDLDTRSASVYLSPPVLARVLEARTDTESVGEAITRVLSEMARRRLVDSASPAAAAAKVSGQSWTDAIAQVQGLRPLQVRVLHGALPALQAGRLVLAEGGTGLGKSRILALTANASVAHGVRAVVAAPTLVVLSQIIQEWVGLGNATVRGGILLGRSQFISPTLVHAALDDPDVRDTVHEAYIEAVRTWLQNNCPPLSDPGLLRAGLRYLREDLERLAPTFPVADCLADDGDEEVELVVQQMRAGAADADVVFTTHASVAASIKLMRIGREGIVPISGRVLLVDEAHQLEATFAASMSHGVSSYAAIVRLRKVLEQATKRKDREALERLIGHLRTWPDRLDVLDQHPQPQYAFIASGHGHDDLKRRVSDAVSTLVEHTAAVAHVAPFTRELADAAERMATTLKGIDANGPGYGALVIRYSPVRRWPSVIIGHTNLASAFHDLWGRVHGALLTSGTLSLIDGLGNPTFAHAVHTLSLPADRVQVLEPAIPEWLLSTPTIWLPDASVAASFVPPQDVEAESGDEDPAYVDAIARRLRAIHASAQGGVLVLLTSYRMIWALQSALTDMGEDLITQSNTIGVEALKRSFVSARRQGRKPMWLGTGPAWTGLDLRDELAASGAEDLLLTDLVIPRVPMPRPETLPAIWRAQRIGFDAIRIEGTFLFRQGLGRLVRRDGLSHRRIWVLDGRLVPHNGASTRWVYVYDLVRRELARYPKRERYV